MDNRSFRKVLVRGMALLKKLQRPILVTLDLFKSKLAHQTPRQSISNHIRNRILLISDYHDIIIYRTRTRFRAGTTFHLPLRRSLCLAGAVANVTDSGPL